MINYFETMEAFSEESNRIYCIKLSEGDVPYMTIDASLYSEDDVNELWDNHEYLYENVYQKYILKGIDDHYEDNDPPEDKLSHFIPEHDKELVKELFEEAIKRGWFNDKIT